MIKKKIIYISIIAFVFSCKNQTKVDYDKSYGDNISELINQKDYFKAQRLLKKNGHNLNNFHKHLFSAELNNVFNKLTDSESSIDYLFKIHLEELNDELKVNLIELSLENNIKFFNYKKAYKAAEKLLTEYKTFLDSSKIKKLNNEIKLWRGLMNSPKQEIAKKEETKINLIDGFKIPVLFNENDQSVNMLFDTGANLSLIVTSLVEPLGMQLLDANYTVKSIVGQDIEAGLAIAPKISFGNIELCNAVFMVFPDEVMTFKAQNFKINGIIGYPVIEALKEVQFKKEGALYIPKETSKKPFKNLALDFLTPIVEANIGNDSLVFSFDTGADATWLYKRYYELHKNEIESSNEKVKVKIGGIGGSEEYDAYQLNIKMKIGNSIITLDSIDTTIENVAKTHNYYYGNIGQDAVKAYDNLILNFEDMYVELTND